MANIKLRMLKVLEILKETDEENPITAPQIVDKLENYGLNAERKAVCRDISILSEEYDVVKHEDNKKGYYINERTYEDWEIKVLVDSVSGLKFLNACDKKNITDKLLYEVSSNSRKSIAKLSFSGKKSSRYNIDNLMKAIKSGKKILAKYHKRNEKYLLNPYDLVLDKECYYLLCNVDKYDNLSFFRVDKFTEIEILNDNVKIDILGDNPSMTLEEFAKKSIYKFTGDTVTVHIETYEYMIDTMKDFFGDDVSIIKRGDVVNVRANVLDSDGLYFWLLQQGDNLKVITPTTVREKLIAKIDKMREIYR
ncbi:MAG: WYL domain-containing protein [Clostridia bacterium]